MSNSYPHIAKDIDRWPISKFSRDKESFIKEMNEYTLQKLLNNNELSVEEILASTIYKEKIRIKVSPWKVDPRDEKDYWNKLEKKFKENTLSPDKEEKNIALLSKIINRYSVEITGNFNPKTFRFARKFLSGFFRRLFNKTFGGGSLRPWGNNEKLYEKLKVSGSIDELREIAKKGTIVMVPTHHSNLDSIMVGYMVDAILGLPAFIYGAGLNLFDVEVMAYFMNRLGAYKVDRRKKNKIYLDSLNTFSTLSIKRGVHTIFFPEGTRSRSGSLQKKLKLGLLSTLIEAQRLNCQEEKEEKIYVVPLTINYHFVLEARQLIDQHLRATGKEKYLKPGGAGMSFFSNLSFIKKIFSKESEAQFRVGKPMDVFGNDVNSKGQSFDEKGKILEISDYFKFDGDFKENLQRERVYTRILGDKIKKSYLINKVILSSQLIAFIAFEYFKQSRPNDDIYTLINLPLDFFVIPRNEMISMIDQMKKELVERESKGEFKLSKAIYLSSEELFGDGLKHLGTYHAKKALKLKRNKTLVSEDYKLLYFYHNQLADYNIKLTLNSEVEQQSKEERLVKV